LRIGWFKNGLFLPFVSTFKLRVPVKLPVPENLALSLPFLAINPYLCCPFIK
jgi:hypothetical protein